jgi:hypothetical protein
MAAEIFGFEAVLLPIFIEGFNLDLISVTSRYQPIRQAVIDHTVPPPMH